MKRNGSKNLLAALLALGLLLFVTGVAEELGELDLYAPEVYAGEVDVEAPESPAEAAQYNAPGAEMEGPTEYAVSAPEAVPTEALVQTIALTGRKASARMNVNDTLQIVLNEGETGTFKSKNAKLATVSEGGLVTALKKGKVKITFKPAKGRKRTLTIRIVDPWEPKKVSIAEGRSVTVNLGDTLQLNAVLAPETAQSELTWKSSKAKVACVDDSGAVSALKEGKAKITVTTRNKKKAKITVKVVDPNKPTGVRLTQGGSAEMIAGSTALFTAELIPETAGTTLTWKSSNRKVATVTQEGVVVALRTGKATITVTTANGKKAKCRVRVSESGAPMYDIELADYLGGRFSDVREALGFSGYGNDDIRFGGYGDDPDPEYAEYCRITQDPRRQYTLYSLHLGLSLPECSFILAANGWWQESDDGQWRTYRYKDEEFDLEINLIYDARGLVTELWAVKF